MARPTSREAQFSNTLPASVRGVNRRSLLRGAVGAGALLGVPALLSACVAAVVATPFRRQRTSFPFGPWLVGGAFVALALFG